MNRHCDVCCVCIYMPANASIQAKVIFQETKIQFSFNENSDTDDNFAIFSNQGDSNCIGKHILLPSLKTDTKSPSVCHCCGSYKEKTWEQKKLLSRFHSKVKLSVIWNIHCYFIINNNTLATVNKIFFVRCWNYVVFVWCVYVLGTCLVIKMNYFLRLFKPNDNSILPLNIYVQFGIGKSYFHWSKPVFYWQEVLSLNIDKVTRIKW